MVAEILNTVQTKGTGSYALFDAFIYELLEAHQKSKGKDFSSDPNRNGLHGFAASGIQDIQGPTHIEVRFNLEKHTARRLRDHIVHVTTRNRRKDEPFKNLLLISPSPISQKQRVEFSQLSTDEDIPFTVHVWGMEELDNLIDLHPNVTKDILGKLGIESAEKGQVAEPAAKENTVAAKEAKEEPIKVKDTSPKENSIPTASKAEDKKKEEVPVAKDTKEERNMSENKVEAAPKPVTTPEPKVTPTPMATTNSGDWREVRNGRLQTLKNIYKKEEFSLIIGEGVSNSAGIPQRDTLLNSLFVQYLTNSSIQSSDIQQIAATLNNDSDSTSTSATYLKKQVDKSASDAKAFAEKMGELLYKERNSEKPMASEMIKAIVELCIPKRRGAVVRSVTSYNYDDLLERQLKALSVESKSIYADNTDVDEAEELPIYHVNGYLPEGNNTGSKNELVFSAEGQNAIANNPYHWANLVQLDQMKDSHCLLIGMNMNNRNLKRLLDIDKAARTVSEPRHFAFAQRWTADKFGQSNSSTEKFLSHHHGLMESMMKDLGVSVIWYEKDTEVAQLLRAVRS